MYLFKIHASVSNHVSLTHYSYQFTPFLLYLFLCKRQISFTLLSFSWNLGNFWSTHNRISMMELITLKTVKSYCCGLYHILTCLECRVHGCVHQFSVDFPPFLPCSKFHQRLHGRFLAGKVRSWNRATTTRLWESCCLDSWSFRFPTREERYFAFLGLGVLTLPHPCCKSVTICDRRKPKMQLLSSGTQHGDRLK